MPAKLLDMGATQPAPFADGDVRFSILARRSKPTLPVSASSGDNAPN
jgi:hypothetical protein